MNRNCYTELCATLALGGLVRMFCHTRRDIGDKKAGREGYSAPNGGAAAAHSTGSGTWKKDRPKS